LTADSHARRAERVLIALGLVAFAATVVMRVWALGRIPGMNGDEAWYGAHARDLLTGTSIPLSTPTGSPLNPFFFLPQLALHSVFGASFALEHTPAVAAGLLALAASYLLCTRLYGRATAAATTLLLAALPIDIAYSRVGWDACESLLAGVLLVYCSLLSLRPGPSRNRWLIATVAAFVSAVFVHATNAFLVGFLAYPVLIRLRERRARPPAYTGVLLSSLVGPLWAWPPQFTHGEQIPDFLHLSLRLLSGDSAYSYMAGTRLLPHELAVGLSISDALVLVALCLVGYGAFRAWREERTADVPLLAGGLALAMLVYAWSVDPSTLTPNEDRYRLFLLAPVVLLAGRAVVWWAGRNARSRVVVLAAVVTVACASATGFALQYFRPLMRDGGSAGLPFRTADREPKLAALRVIQRRDADALVVAPSWWAYWPMHYLTIGDRHIHVITLEAFRLRGPLADVARHGPVWFALFTGFPEYGEIPKALKAAGVPFTTHFVPQADGRRLLALLRVPRRS
jgi:hypothetical protein